MPLASIIRDNFEHGNAASVQQIRLKNPVTSKHKRAQTSKGQRAARRGTADLMDSRPLPSGVGGRRAVHQAHLGECRS